MGSTTAAPSSRALVLWTVLQGSFWLILLTLTAGIIPRFERIFMDFGVDLPGSALLTIRASRMVAQLLPMFVLLVAGILVLEFLALRSLRRDPQSRGVAGTGLLVMTALPLGLIAFHALTIGLVWLQIHEKLKG